ncbi:MAG: FtsQ-type POTRA domain-containing protein [Pontiellaceae bacterium]|nr:FtsQ-type POTRA domain-containing protein [Pontiellaceae bacterium]
MAVKKSNTNRGNIQYVKDRKRAERRGPVVARRVAAIIILLVLVVLLCVGVVWGFFWAERALFSENPTFTIKKIDVSITGEKFTEQQICEMGEIHEGINLFALHFKDLRKKYLRFPDIASIKFERQLPDTLRIQVRERVPIARVLSINYETRKRYISLIDAEGVLLSKDADDRREMQYDIVGLTEQMDPGDRLDTNEKVMVALDIIRLCNENPQWDHDIVLQSIDVSPYDYVILNLKDNVSVKMPLYSLEAKLSLLAYTISFCVMSGDPPVDAVGDLMTSREQLIFKPK